MSIPTRVLLSKIRAAGYSVFAGVPCSNFGDLFDQVAETSGFLTVPAANEGSAVALAAGAVLSGRRGVVALQNSGLGNIINPLTSLLMVNKIPLLLLLSVRGHPEESADEPQHAIMGAKTKALLNELSIDWCDFDGTESGLDHALARGSDAFHRAAPFALLFRQGQLSDCGAAKKDGLMQFITGSVSGTPLSWFATSSRLTLSLSRRPDSSLVSCSVSKIVL
ncbi:thiamine pyrophosphate-binding protein [Bradyrhizobium sp. UFLA05-153]